MKFNLIFYYNFTSKMLIYKYENMDIDPKINQLTELTPLRNPSSQNFLTVWFRINDSLIPKFVPRWKYNLAQSAQTIMDRNKNDNTIWIPTDLHLWEMPQIMERIDARTFKNHPELAQMKANEIKQLGDMFIRTSIYLAKRLDKIVQGRDLCTQTIDEFYKYGQSLKTGKKASSFPQLEQLPLTAEETQQVYRWLAGEYMYTSPKRQVANLASEQSPVEETDEETRIHKLNQLFQNMQQSSPSDQNQYPKGYHRAIQTPLTELQRSIYDKGIEMLKKGIGIKTIDGELRKLGYQIEGEEQKLYDILSINKLRDELETIKTTKATVEEQFQFTSRVANSYRGQYIRQVNDIIYDYNAKERKNIDIYDKLDRLARISDFPAELLARLRDEYNQERENRITKKQIEIAQKIQQAVSLYKYNKESYQPTQIIDGKTMNCIGATLLGTSLLEAADVDSLVVDIPYHALLFVITANQKVYWADMLDKNFNGYIENADIQGVLSSGRQVTIQDIVNFSKMTTEDTVQFQLTAHNPKLKWISTRQDQSPFVNVYNQEIKGRALVLNSLGSELMEKGMYIESISALQMAHELCPNSSFVYNNLGCVYNYLHLYDQARDAFQKALQIDPKLLSAITGIGNSYRLQKDFTTADEYFQKAYMQNPNDSYTLNCFGFLAYDQKQYDEALKYFYTALKSKKTPATYNNIAAVLLVTNRFSEAEAYCHQALSLDHKSSFSYNQLGSIYMKEGRNQEAVEAFQLALDYRKSPTFYYNLAHALENLGKGTEAKSAYLNVLQIGNEDEDKEIMDTAKERIAILSENSINIKK